MMTKSILAMYIGLAQLAQISFDPNGTLDILIYFHKPVPAPVVTLTLPGLSPGANVSQIVFDQVLGSFSSSRGHGDMRSADGVNVHATLRGQTIGPEQLFLIASTETNQIIMNNFANLFGGNIVAGDFIKISLAAEHLIATPGLVKVDIGGDTAYKRLVDPSRTHIPTVAVGLAGDLEVETATRVINRGCDDQVAQIRFVQSNGTLVNTIERTVPALGSLLLTGYDFFQEKGPLVSGYYVIEDCNCGVSSSWVINRRTACPAAGPCRELKNEGAAGVAPAPEGNVFFIPQFAQEQTPFLRSAVTLSNATPMPATVQVQLFSEDQTTPIGEPVELVIPANNNTSRFLDELLPASTGLPLIHSDVPLGATSVNTDDQGFVRSSNQVETINGELFLVNR